MDFKKYVNNVPYSNATRQQWRDENDRITRQFKADLLVEFEVAGHPKAENVWQLAWEHGHPSGLQEVYNYFEEFVLLIK